MNSDDDNNRSYSPDPDSTSEDAQRYNSYARGTAQDDEGYNQPEQPSIYDSGRAQNRQYQDGYGPYGGNQNTQDDCDESYGQQAPYASSYSDPSFNAQPPPAHGRPQGRPEQGNQPYRPPGSQAAVQATHGGDRWGSDDSPVDRVEDYIEERAGQSLMRGADAFFGKLENGCSKVWHRNDGKEAPHVQHHSPTQQHQGQQHQGQQHPAQQHQGQHRPAQQYQAQQHPRGGAHA